MRLVHTFAMIGAPCLLLIAASLESGRHTNPPVTLENTIQENLRVTPAVNAMLRRSCYDCHSSETRWPWYSQVSGIGSLIEHDVEGGREAMNFSEWSSGPGKTPLQAGATLLAACEAVKQHRMPKSNYLLLHPDAAPKPPQIDEFCAWARSEAAELMPATRQP
jgi:hypothetical protein